MFSRDFLRFFEILFDSPHILFDSPPIHPRFGGIYPPFFRFVRAQRRSWTGWCAPLGVGARAWGPGSGEGLSLQTSGSRLQASDFRLQASGIGLQASGFRHQASGIRLQASGIRLQTSDFRLQASALGEPGTGVGLGVTMAAVSAR